MADDPLTIRTGRPVRPTCPRCGSAMIVIGRLTDAHGEPVRFSREGASDLGSVRGCYCNDCGEVTLTLA